jgi:hypothetical protein
MRIRPVAALVLLSLLVAVVPASAGGAATVTGRVLDQSGKPVAGAYVRLTRPAEDHGGGFLGGLFGFFDALACAFVAITGDRCDYGPDSVAARTDAAGRYTLRLPYDRYVSGADTDTLEIVGKGGGAAPPRLETKVAFPGRSVKLRDYRLWGQAAHLDPVTPLHRTLHVDPLPSALGSAKDDPDVWLLQGTRRVWSFGAVPRDRQVDTRIAEHGTTSAQASVVARLGSYDVTYTSTARAVRDTVKPLSRGRSCFAYGAKEKPLRLSGCRFSDGRLGDPVSGTYRSASGKACTTCANRERLLVDLAEPGVVGAVVVRGCGADGWYGLPNASGRAPVEVSVEGTRFVPYPTGSPAGDGVAVGLPLPARYVRIDLSSCRSVPTEVSVFAPVAL